MGSYLYFHYDLNDCGSSLKTVGGNIIYSNSVEFMPAGPEEEEEEVKSQGRPQTMPYVAHPPGSPDFTVLIKLKGYVPHGPWTFRRTLGAKRRFTLSVCNEKWEILTVSEGVGLGELLYFEAAAADVLAEDERIFISFCHMTASKDSNSTPRHDLICNSGWEELHGDNSVCACCDSVFEVVDFGSLDGVEQAVVTSQPWSFNTKHHLLGNTWGRPNTLKVKFLQKYTKEQEVVFQGGVEESLSPAEVDDEHAVQQVLTWPGLNISPVRKEEEERNIQVKFLQKDAEEQEEEVFQDVIEESLSPAEVDDEHAVQQVLTWSGLVSPVRKEEVSKVKC
ncbi:hypothetical protein MHYP_G00288310 [Metynnis hypsauchen]